MIYNVISTKAVLENEEEAMKWLRRLAKYWNENLSGNVEILRHISGAWNQVHWVGSHDSLEEWARAEKKVNEDQGFQAIYEESKGKNYFTDTESTLYETEDLEKET